MDSVITGMQDKGLLDGASASVARSLMGEGKPLEDAVLAADGLTEESVLRFLADTFEIPYIDALRLEHSPPPREFLAAFPVRLLLRHRLLPLEDKDGQTLVATSRITDTSGLDELRMASGRDITPALAPSTEIDRCLKKVLGVGADTLQSLSAGPELQVLDADKEDDLDLANAAQDASIIRFVNQILTEAIESRATDVHIEPFEDALRLRYRIDGVLVEANAPGSVRRFHAAIVSRIKILSHLDIAEKRLPRDRRPRLDHPHDPRRGRRAPHPRPRRRAARHRAPGHGRTRPPSL